jgi:hypothetical protein
MTPDDMKARSHRRSIMTSTITAQEQASIASYLDGRVIASGLGTEKSACSIAAINLALYGILTDDVPECMSEVIGRWIIGVQDDMPDGMRNSREWRQLLPLAAGTGRKHEAERNAIIQEWMWTKVLPSLQPIADEGGYGVEWRAMITERTAAAAWAARAAEAAGAAAWAAARAAARATAAERAVAAAAATWAVAAAAATWASHAAWAVRAAEAAEAAAATARAAAATRLAAAAEAAAWREFDPIGLLAELIAVSGEAS